MQLGPKATAYSEGHFQHHYPIGLYAEDLLCRGTLLVGKVELKLDELRGCWVRL